MSGKGLLQLLLRKFSLHFKSRAKIGYEAREKSVVCIVNDPLSYVGILSRHLDFRFQPLACACLIPDDCTSLLTLITSLLNTVVPDLFLT
jgi:hypothetical protein